MRYPCDIQISDLEAIQSDFEQELTIEEAEKVVGGSNSSEAISSFEAILSSEAGSYSIAISSSSDVLSIIVAGPVNPTPQLPHTRPKPPHPHTPPVISLAGEASSLAEEK